MKQQSRSLVRAEHLPIQLTPFIGRADEVTEIRELLTAPACRLLTLVGPGGIGKTRLAIQVATELLNNFSHGVYFIPLQPIQSVEFLISAVADSLGFPLRGQEDAEVQLLTYLHERDILLVLDNFEHLLTEQSTQLLTSILEAALRVKLLVTSREVLNLQEEWLYPVRGLAFPGPPSQPSPFKREGEAYSAVQLFVERARRVRRDFSLADELAGVIRICQLVEGIPLALELAASWTKTLRCEVIAAEIQRNLDFLTTSLRNVPDRQRNMRAVFDHSWQGLSEEERSVFKRLAVFRGGFRLTAAERVARASLATLSALVDKSLLRLEPGGRYQLHELLRQYAAEQLVLSPEDVAHVYDWHCVYYLNFLRQLQADITGRRQQEAVKEIAADLENVRAAWQWAIQQAKDEEIRQAANTWQYFLQFQSRYLEGADLFEKAAKTLDHGTPAHQQRSLLAELLIYQGWFCMRLGRLQQAETVVEKSQAILDELGIFHPRGAASDPLAALGTLANIRGDYVEAERLGEESRRLNETNDDRANLMDAYYVLTSAAFGQGHYETAHRYAQQAYAVAKEINDQWMSAYILNDLGNIARALGEYAQARLHYQASYAIREAFNDPEGMAVALNHLGKIASLQGAQQEAEHLYQQSLAIYHEIGDRGGLASVLSGLGGTACALADYGTAQHHFQQALQIAAEIHFIPLTLSILIGIAELLAQIGQPERGVQLLALVSQHPASDQETKARAHRLLTRYEADLRPDVFVAAKAGGATGDLETLVTTLQTELAVPIGVGEQRIEDRELKIEAGKLGAGRPKSVPPSGLNPQASTSALPPSSSSLVEPLTPRELEVLQLIAGGRTNQQIADELIISVGTAKFYTSQIYSKLNVNSRTQAVARARELNLLA